MIGRGTAPMELAQLLVTPATLLTAFIFFWNQAKTGRDELKRELKSDIGALKEELKEQITSVRREVAAVRDETKEEIALLRTEVAAVRDETKAEIREEIAPLRTEVAAIRTEMHDMNGRLGRVEGLLRTSDAG